MVQLMFMKMKISKQEEVQVGIAGIVQIHLSLKDIENQKKNNYKVKWDY